MIDMNEENTQETPVSPLTENDTAFIREQIKARPINKKKLFRRTLVTALLAVVFGTVASLSFLILEPFISERLTPPKEEEPLPITFPTSDDEIQPEDLYADDAEIMSAQEQSVAESIQASIEASEQDRINSAVDFALSRVSMDEKAAEELYRSLKQLSSAINPSLVLVRTVKEETDFVGGTIERGNDAPGLIVADNGIDYLILTYASVLQSDAEFLVRFANSEVLNASVKMTDEDSGLMVLSVPKRLLSSQTAGLIKVATLGSTLSSSLTGTPVVAVGSPVGVYPSVSYGIISSEKLPIDLADKALKVYATDIYGGGEAAGFLIDYESKVVGIIYPEPVEGVDSNRILAYSITETKNLIEHLANATPLPRLGIHGTSVTEDLSRELDLPSGAFILQVDVDSPAITAGLQSGDIITTAKGRDIVSWEGFVSVFEDSLPGETLRLVIQRRGTEAYEEMNLSITIEGEEP